MMKQQSDTKLMLPKIEAHLLPDERLLWMGKPAWRRLLSFPNTGFEPVAAMVIGIVVVLMIAGIILTRTSNAPALTGLLLITLLGIVIFVPSIVQYFVAENTIYAVTTHRALILEGDKLTSFGAADINMLECNDEQDGTGDVIFKSIIRERMIPTGYMPYAAEVEEKVGFFGIPNPRHVHEILRHTLRTSPIQMWQEKTFEPQRSKASAHA